MNDFDGSRMCFRSQHQCATRAVAVVSVLVSLMSLDGLLAQSLPTWGNEDRARLKKGELVPGAALLVEVPPERPEPRVAPEPEVPSLEPVVPEPDYDPKVIPDEYLGDYFSTSTSSSEGYLIDPQRLLSMQESLDREGFLEYHADDSEVDIRMYLFDAQQEIPPPYTLQKLVRDRYSDGPLSAVVFCFLGDPSRNVLAFGGEGAMPIPIKDVRKMLESAQMKAQEKSDPSAQVESFIVQLSIRLYWFEKALAEARVAATPVTGGTTHSTREKKERSASPGVMAKVKPYFFYAVVGFSGFALSVFAIGLAWVLWTRSRTYHFPVLEPPHRLGADYAAGVGAVLAFHNKLGSPSSQ
ncbi:MAG: hypothetical protein N2F24_17990, partial [Deltaproteobacteria bacterium]